MEPAGPENYRIAYRPGRSAAPRNCKEPTSLMPRMRADPRIRKCAAMCQSCTFFEIFLEKGYNCNASSGRILVKRSRSGILSDFRPANPVKCALFRSKIAGFYYGKPKLTQGTRTRDRTKVPEEFGAASTSLFKPRFPMQFKQDMPFEAITILFPHSFSCVNPDSMQNHIDKAKSYLL